MTSITPANGPYAGGTNITVTGTNLSTASAVYFGANTGTGLTVNGDTSLTVTSPAGSGTVDVTVRAPSGTSATASGDKFTYRSKEGCFIAIATAAYGSYLDPHVMALRYFWNHCLLTFGLGRWFVSEYYHYSPPVAAVIAANSTLRLLARIANTTRLHRGLPGPGPGPAAPAPRGAACGDSLPEEERGAADRDERKLSGKIENRALHHDASCHTAESL